MDKILKLPNYLFYNTIDYISPSRFMRTYLQDYDTPLSYYENVPLSTQLIYIRKIRNGSLRESDIQKLAFSIRVNNVTSPVPINKKCSEGIGRSILTDCLAGKYGILIPRRNAIFAVFRPDYNNDYGCTIRELYN